MRNYRKRQKGKAIMQIRQNQWKKHTVIGNWGKMMDYKNAP
jgi:hypothetical protein